MNKNKSDSGYTEMLLKPIGIIHSPITEPGGAPIQPCFAEGIEGTVEVFDEYAEGLKDLDGFERIYLVYWFHRAKKYRLQVTPYLETRERGLFATRAPSRPNPIGLSNVRLHGIEGNILRISELDILDGTPLLDIKPYAPRFDCYETDRNGWLDDVAGKEARADNSFYDK